MQKLLPQLTRSELKYIYCVPKIYQLNNFRIFKKAVNKLHGRCVFAEFLLLSVFFKVTFF